MDRKELATYLVKLAQELGNLTFKVELLKQEMVRVNGLLLKAEAEDKNE